MRLDARLLLALALFAGLGCNKDATWITVTVNVDPSDPHPPSVYQLELLLRSQRTGAEEPLHFPTSIGSPLHFPATSVITVPPEPDALDISVGAIGQDGKLIPGSTVVAPVVTVEPYNDTSTEVSF